MANLKLKDINKIYPNGAHAVVDFNLDIKDGEFIVLVGPSGCGKSTTLRMIAGLEGISSGDMILDGEKINRLAPADRNIAMVFQNYALYPHMTVYENMGISLKVKHEQRNKIHDEVLEAADSLDLFDYLNRLPANLSGGQRQRVALGRTIVRQPKVFLMDEPLSNLDAKLREKTRTELVKLQKELGVTTVYVTHDQIEAMTMADRIVIMSDAHVQQIGSAFDVYHYPDNMFVAGFIGTPNMNFIDGTYSNGVFTFEGGALNLTEKHISLLSKYEGKELVLGVRPESIECSEAFLSENKNNIFDLAVDYSEFLGKEYYTTLELNPTKKIIAKIDGREDVDSDNLKVAFNLEQIHFFDKETTNRIVEE